MMRITLILTLFLACNQPNSVKSNQMVVNLKVASKDLLKEIAKSLEQGDINSLSTYWAEEPTLSIYHFEEELEGKEAVNTVLQEFFTNYIPTKFRWKNQGISEGRKSYYGRGILETKQSVFQVNALLINGELVELAIDTVD